MIAVVEEAIDAVRNLAEDLRGGLFEDLPLTMMIEMEVVELSKRNQIPAHVLDMPVDEPMLTSQQRVVTLRILQEALTNIVDPRPREQRDRPAANNQRCDRARSER